MTRNQKKGFKYELGVILSIFLIGLSSLIYYLANHPLAVLNPGGIIAAKERNLMVTTTLLMLLIVIPVFILTFTIAWRYRASNTKAKYTPDWDHHRAMETVWWAFPCAIIVVLAIITWNSTHQLDPFRPIDSTIEPINVQVVALQWKWLFIYPDQQIATVNFVQFPEATPVNFNITADAPMNSFWIPRLGGQIYAMAGMKRKLHLMADSTGDFRGSSANLSGKGFSSMSFMARSSTQQEFDSWVSSVKKSGKMLNDVKYKELSKPSENNKVVSFQLQDKNLYDKIIMKYMMPSENIENSKKTSHANR